MSIKKPKYQFIEGFEVVGLQATTSNAQEYTKAAQLPKLWQEFERGLKATSKRLSLPIFGVYSDYASDANGDYTVTAGLCSEHEELIKHRHKTVIQAGVYMVFENHGPMPQTVLETWQWVWQFFENQTCMQRCYTTDFERYDGDEAIRVYIGITEQ